MVIPGTVVAIVGAVNANAGEKTGRTGVVGRVMPVGNNPSKARVAKEPPPPMVGVDTGVGVGTPPRRKALVRVGKEGVITGATGNMGATTGAKAVGAASAGKTDKGKVILKVARGAGGIKVVTLNPKGVSAGAVAIAGGMALVGSKTDALR